MIKKTRLILMLFPLYFFMSHVTYGQIKVNTDNSVSIGIVENDTYKYHVDMINENSLTGLRIKSTHKSTQTQYGLYNLMELDGSENGHKFGFYNGLLALGMGQRIGISNHVEQGSGNTSSVTGIRNLITSNGGGQYSYGLYNFLKTGPNSTGKKYGIYNVFDLDGTGTRYGIYNLMSGAYNDSKIGLYSYVGPNQDWAGFFVGNVCIQGTTTHISDRNQKENITDLESGITKVKKMKPKNFKMKQNNGNGNGGNNGNDPARNHFGFIAQDMEVDFPELVSELVSPGAPIYETTTDEEGNEVEELVGHEPDETILGLNYIEIIPILTKAIQEQQNMLEQQQGIIEDLLKRIEKLEN